MINLGKYAEDKQFRKVQQEDVKHIFKVDVNLYNKRHSEWYSIKSSDVKIARNMGLLNKNKNGYIQYLDWKPLGGATNIDGGIKKVNNYSRDEFYVYAHTDEKIYSLPIYLEKKMVRKDFILFGKREDKGKA